MEELAQKGPLKPEELRGISKYEQFAEYYISPLPSCSDAAVKAGLAKMPPKVGSRQVEDKTSQRTGWVLDEETTKMMLQHITEAKAAIHKDQVAKKVPLTEKVLLDYIDTLKGVMMITYPAYHGLGEWEPAKLILESKEMFEDPDVTIFINKAQMYEEEKTSIWYAGKEMQRGKKLMDYLGKNEKTKVIVKLTSGGAGAPPREPVIDPETHKQMLAFYYKKQEEAKKAESGVDDGYLESPWADPRGLKSELHGVNNIKWKQENLSIMLCSMQQVHVIVSEKACKFNFEIRLHIQALVYIRIQINLPNRMKPSAIAPVAATLPISSRSKCIKKVHPLAPLTNARIMPVGASKENLKVNALPAMKKKTVLLNNMLGKGNGSYKNGNILVIRMSPTNCIETHQFKSVIRMVLQIGQLVVILTQPNSCVLDTSTYQANSTQCV
eukprot:TRINITY_DN120209_c0_g1_i1.p1 TRINITY_DN120209_c0_g1~~TRINITY_DN120209_c0_g1_i1.p1  ORF type:complete len:439 (+),score=26.10 TRINITY_DN120209_c0_g1_i1:284-1600(+)